MFDKFKANDYVFIQSTDGEGVGNFEINKIISVTSQKMDLKYPLTHTYKNDLKNHSQVIRIFQYRTAQINKDVIFSHKERKDGVGGVIVLMASGGFTMKGHIIDLHAEVEAIDVTKEKMKKSKAKVIFGLANYSGNIARKVFDIKFTTRFTSVTLLQDKTIFVVNNKTEYERKKFQHITIPPDLNLHLTDEKLTKDYKFFKPNKQILDKNGLLIPKYIKLVTVVYPPIDKCFVFTSRKYAAGFMVAFAKMPHWTQQSHFTVELFAIRDENIRIPIGEHKKGELGVFPPYIHGPIKYLIQPFIIMNHNFEKSVQIKFWQ